MLELSMNCNRRGLFYGIILLVVVSSSAKPAFAHDITFSPLFGVSCGQFSQNTSAMTMGVDAAYNWEFPNWSLKTSVGFWAYGKQSIPAKRIDSTASDSIDYQFDNNILQASVSARYRWAYEGVNPYLEAMAGVMGIYTEVSSRDSSSADALKIVGSKLVQASNVPFGGIGIGAIFPLRQVAAARSGRTGFSANLDVNLSYLLSTDVEYYSINSVKTSNQVTQVTRFKSSVALLVSRVGINLVF